MAVGQRARPTLTVKMFRRLRERRPSWPRTIRGITSRWTLLPLGAIALMVVAFLVYGAITRARPTVFPRGHPTFAAPAPTPTALPSGSAPSPTPGATTSPGPSGGTVATDAPPPPPPPSSGPALPAEGTYALAVEGAERVRFGPFSACDRSFPDRVSLAVRRSSGETPTSFDFDLRLFPGEPDKHDERHIYRYTAAAVFLDFEEATVTCAGVKQSTVISFSPPQERARLPLRVGASWSGSGGSENRTETYRAHVLRTEKVVVEGRALTTFVVETTIELTGDEQGHRLQRWWYSPAAAMPVRWFEEISASRFGATYSSEATYTVLDLT